MTITMPRFDGNAACAETNPDAFFPEPGGQGFMDVRDARRVCSGCEIKTACLKWALDTGEPYGVWGGMTEMERRAISHRRRTFIEPDPINHGTEAGAKQHRRRGQQPCMECREGSRIARVERLGRRTA